MTRIINTQLRQPLIRIVGENSKPGASFEQRTPIIFQYMVWGHLKTGFSTKMSKILKFSIKEKKSKKAYHFLLE